MKWHKVEDYPVGSDEYVLVSRKTFDKYRTKFGCFFAKLVNGKWYSADEYKGTVIPTDRWCHIDLPKD